ncbi:hypothetical protein FJT64_000539 [Amphibalanus amphitrite]|uniref:Uncharacterized protein n=1 Tax=Amphibalanus amphitrite TaxID=1232801 RepID=A0A6A4VVQ4_AMPAM|nr:hypothetical protein FJT64_000539 [Amphibalanus amphitrite]
MPGKERPKKDDKKLLKGLQIFKRSKSKPSLHPTPSITAAVDADAPAAPGASTPVFTPASPTVTSAASLDPLIGSESPPAPAPARRSSVTPISLSRIVGDVPEPEPVTCDAASVDGSSATPSTDTELNGFHGAINGELAEKLRKVEELERKIKRMKEDVDRATERKRRQEELDSKIIEALILEKMQGMGLLKSQLITCGGKWGSGGAGLARAPPHAARPPPAVELRQPSGVLARGAIPDRRACLEMQQTACLDPCPACRLGR